MKDISDLKQLRYKIDGRLKGRQALFDYTHSLRDAHIIQAYEVVIEDIDSMIKVRQ